MTGFLMTERGKLAYVQRPGQGPGVLFLGGFGSDMNGTKALALDDWARAGGQAFRRFDYTGHGASDGSFEDGCIGDWAEDATAMLADTAGPQVLVGSSMGGWIALLLARRFPDRIAGLVTIAAAPDFTLRTWDEELTDAQRAEVRDKGRTEMPSGSGAPYVFTARLFEDGRRHQVLDRPLPLPFPVRFLQGTADADVPVATALRLLDHATGPDLRLTLVAGADHRFSSPACLRLIETSVADVLKGPP
jgi:pimeloyl-ACP methyl ester carboxylesterase